jgi:site-specific DNA recombinase
MGQAHEDRAGIPAQREVCRKVAEDNKLALHWNIEIIGVSGASVMHSPGMRRLVQIVQSGECAGVVMRAVDRLMRPEDFSAYQILDVLKQYHVKVYTEMGDFDLSNPNDAMMLTFHCGIAGFERTQILKRLHGGKETKRREGRSAPGARCLPYGVRHDKKTGWSYDPETSGRVKLLFELFTSGETNGRALARKTGIGYDSIVRTLKNPIYTGWYVIDTMRDTTAKKLVDEEGRYRASRKIPRPPEMVHRHKVIERGLIDDSVFAQAQTILAVRANMHWKRGGGKNDPFVFRGLLRCGECGGRVTTMRHRKNSNSPVHDYYICQSVKGYARYQQSRYKATHAPCTARRMNRQKLETVIDKLIETKLADPAHLWKLMEAHEKATERDDVDAKIAGLERDLKAVAERKARLTDLYLDGDLSRMSKDDYKRRLADLTEHEQTITHELASARPASAQLSQEYLSLMLMPFLNWQEMEPDEKQALLRQTLPIFNVTTLKDSPGRGDWRTAEYRVNGFFMTLVGDAPATMEGQTGTPEPARGKARGAKTRINSGDDRVVSMSHHARTVQHTSPPDGGPFNPAATPPRSIFIDLAL